jgi:hypothetical protein
MAKALIVYLDELILKTSMLQTEIKAKEEDDGEADRQEGIHLTYVTKCDDVIAAAQIYLACRKGQAESMIYLRNEPNDPPEQNPFLPITSPSDNNRLEHAHKKVVVAAQNTCEEIRERRLPFGLKPKLLKRPSVC